MPQKMTTRQSVAGLAERADTPIHPGTLNFLHVAHALPHSFFLTPFDFSADLTSAITPLPDFRWAAPDLRQQRSRLNPSPLPKWPSLTTTRHKPFWTSTPPLSIVNIFLDTGAGASNYIRQDAFDSLRLVCTNLNSANLCGAFGTCIHSSCTVSLAVNFFENSNLNNFILLLSFRVMPALPYEVIIGRKAVVKHRLWEHLIHAGTSRPTLSEHAAEAFPIISP